MLQFPWSTELGVKLCMFSGKVPELCGTQFSSCRRSEGIVKVNIYSNKTTIIYIQAIKHQHPHVKVNDPTGTIYTTLITIYTKCLEHKSLSIRYHHFMHTI